MAGIFQSDNHSFRNALKNWIKSSTLPPTPKKDSIIMCDKTTYKALFHYKNPAAHFNQQLYEIKIS